MAKTKDYIFNSTNFEQGELDTSTGAKQPDSYSWHNARVRSKDFVPVMSGRTVEYSGSLPQYFWVFEYDENKNYLRYGNRTTNFHYKTAFIKITCASAESYGGTGTIAPSALAGGKMTMTGRDLEFGKLPDGTVYTKGRNLALESDTVIDVTAVTTNWKTIKYYKLPNDFKYDIGTPYVLQVWGDLSGLSAMEFDCQDGSHAPWNGIYTFTKRDGRYIFPLTVTNDLTTMSVLTQPNLMYFGVRPRAENTAVRVEKIMFTYGTDIPDHYTPAPEDYVNRTCADYDLTV